MRLSKSHVLALISILIIVAIISKQSPKKHEQKVTIYNGNTSYAPLSKTEDTKDKWDQYQKETTGWATYTGTPLYDDDKKNTFSIKYPPDWTVDGWHIYPQGKKDLSVPVDYNSLIIDIGAGAHGGANTQEIYKTFPAGKAIYVWTSDFLKRGYGGYAVFRLKNTDFIFQIRGVSEENQKEMQQIFDTMLYTFKLSS